MAIVVKIPTQLRAATGGASSTSVDGGTVDFGPVSSFASRYMPAPAMTNERRNAAL